jgi:putative cell wall-binding protein
MTPPATAVVRALVAAALLISTLATPAAAAEGVARAAGEDRIGTAIRASADHREAAHDAILATAYSFPDALAAGALAHALDAPVLLTQPEVLPQRVVDELHRLGVNTVWLLGGEQAVSARVEGALEDLGFLVRRLAGADRYETAGHIARAAGAAATGEVVLALGEHPDGDRAWPDAVAAGALAASPDRVPTLLTRPDALPAATESALADLGAREVLLLGGAATIAPAVEARLADLGYATRRLEAPSRYDTSVALAEDALARFDADARPVVFASGSAFPDGLAAGSLAAELGAPLLMVPPTGPLPDALSAFIRAHAAQLQGGVVVGGPAAASDEVLAQLSAALRGEELREADDEADVDADAEADVEAEAEPEDGAEGPGASGDAPEGPVFEGQASWYGPGFEGNTTASGEPFDPSQLTAAHRTLPFGTIVRVTNLDNGHVVEVRINDRGPYHDDRVIDVSSAAADQLDMKDDGVAHVRGEVLSTP